eukprot:1456924-Rhodomonas_salina.2
MQTSVGHERKGKTHSKQQQSVVAVNKIPQYWTGNWTSYKRRNWIRDTYSTMGNAGWVDNTGKFHSYPASVDENGNPNWGSGWD